MFLATYEMDAETHKLAFKSEIPIPNPIGIPRSCYYQRDKQVFVGLDDSVFLCVVDDV